MRWEGEEMLSVRGEKTKEEGKPRVRGQKTMQERCILPPAGEALASKLHSVVRARFCNFPTGQVFQVRI